ncbi:hypothetical protein [Pseudomonas koreensis]|uniref:hypothetical protein n=1 Tax=Pseudomonas koreensis TaxID=198620 RepID=UPI0014132928|nr:hypothetical protein [Pseudomonas koreensis]NHX02168.1 hypothetical protein [Pseudomonas koreensis]
MSFEILLEKEPSEHFGVQALRGLIRLGDQEESFFAPISFWGRQEYLSSWYSSLSRGLERRQHSVLVTSMLDPELANFLMVWVLYFVGESVHIQNNVVFLDDVVLGFNGDDVNTYVGEREVVNEDGDKISEWVVPLSEVLSFKEKLKREVDA